ncbi:MAG TPA: TetR/AcrR family transcriptional regulator [Solirubrobacterales bacterium]|nr:TetR/AcrR family transcriptional regulator [Solirubrobacterales bacterium]
MSSERAKKPAPTPAPELARLPPGRHGLSREFVAANHRDRLIAACAQTVERLGYADASVARIIEAAAVSRRTFYEHFSSKEDCFIATYDTVMDNLRDRIVAAVERAGEWPQNVPAALAAMLNFFASEPALARLCMVETLAAGPPVSNHHREKVAALAPILRAGRIEAQGPDGPPFDTEEAVIAGVVSLITRWVVVDRTDRLPELLPDAITVALTPFLGVTDAGRIAAASA